VLLAFLLLAFTVVYLALAPRFAHKVYRPMLFKALPMEQDFPAPTVNRIKAEEILLTGHGAERTVGWYFGLSGSSHTVIFSHGNGGNMSTKLALIEGLLAVGLSVLAYDYSGYGKSTGLPDTATVCGNALDASDFLVTKKGVNPEEIILYGESLGGAVSAELASKRSVCALIIQSAFLSLENIAKEKVPLLHIYPEWLFPEPSLNTGRALEKLSLPVLIMHAVDDPVVPYRHGQRLFELAREPKRFVSIEVAGHSNFHADEQELFCAALKSFLSELVQTQTVM
jgi:pimeloyl-ACP methyl ester carboxylesterase